MLEGELARRMKQAEWEAGRTERDWEQLWTELAEMGRRMLAADLPRGPRRDAVLAEELAQADWDRVNELRAEHDLSYAEITALALMVSSEAAVRLLGEYARSQAPDARN